MLCKQVLHINYFKREIVFVNGFAANDPESTGKIWENMIEKFGEDRRKIMLINCLEPTAHIGLSKWLKKPENGPRPIKSS